MRKPFVVAVTLSLLLSGMLVAVRGEAREGNVGEEIEEDEVIEIYDWHDLDAGRDDLDGDYILMDDLDESRAGYEEHAGETANTEDEFEEELGEWLGNDAGDRFEVSYGPVEEILIARDTDDDSEVDVEIVDAEEGIIELQEDTDRYLYVEYKTAEEIGLGLEPIGDHDHRFTGTFDGNGNEIADLYINRLVETYVGLFGYSEGKVENIGVVDSYVSGEERVGGLIGQNYDGTVENSYATGNVSGENYIGGLVGGNSGVVSNSYAEGEVSGGSRVGGLAGYNWDTVENSHAEGDVIGNNLVGGLAGGNHGTLSNSYANGDVSGYGAVVGGLVASNHGTLSNSYANGDVNGESLVGGLVARNYVGGLGDGVTLKNSYYNIDEVLINGGHHVTLGGLFGEQYDDWIEDISLDISDYESTLVSSNGHYEIHSVQGIRDLLGFAGNSEYTFRLAADLDMTEHPGLYVPHLEAEFDGQGHVISDLYLDLPFASQVGMFGQVDQGNLKNIRVTDVDVTGDSRVGGLVGWNSGTVENSDATGDVTGDFYVGGLVGHHRRGIISNTSAAGVVNGNRSIGGLVGHDSGTVTNSYATADVEGEEYVGGLIGWNEIRSVKNSYSTGKVEGEKNLGGLIGRHCGELVENSYATGDVSGDAEEFTQVGGLVGYMAYSTVSNSYATGNVSGDHRVGGLVARESFRGGIENSFWDIETTGQDESDGGTGKTSAEMKDVVTYTDTDTEGLDEPWDFVGDPNDDEGDEYIWNVDEDEIVNEGYPFLTWDDIDLELYDLKLSSDGEGTVEVDSEEVEDGWTCIYEEGTDVNLKAIPGDGWDFQEWQGTGETGEEISITMDEDKSITAVFEEIAEEYDLTFVVEDDEERSIEGVTIKVNHLEETTDSNGKAVFEDLEPDTYEYEVTHDDYETEEGEVDIVDQDKTVAVTMEEEVMTYNLTFEVEDEDDNAIERATVEVNSMEETTEEDGEAVFDGLDPDIYEYEVTHDDYETEDGEVEIVDEDETVSVIMQEIVMTYNLTFEVEDEDGDAIENTTVEVNDVEEITDGDGEAVFEEMDSGTYEYEITHDDYETEDGEVEIVDEDENVTVTMGEEVMTYNLTFEVEDEDGDAIENATVEVNDVEEITDGDGEAVFEEIDSSSYEYEITHDDYETEDGEVEIVDEDETVSVTMSEEEDEENDIPGFTSLMLVFCVMIAVALYHKKKQ